MLASVVRSLQEAYHSLQGLTNSFIFVKSTSDSYLFFEAAVGTRLPKVQIYASPQGCETVLVRHLWYNRVETMRS